MNDEEKFRAEVRNIVREFKKKLDEHKDLFSKEPLYIIILTIPYAIETNLVSEKYNLSQEAKNKIIKEELDDALGLKE